MIYAVDVLKLTTQFIESALFIVGNLTNEERVAMFLSALELRNIIESSFLPKRCLCTLSPDLSMTIKVFSDGATDQVELVKSGIDASHLNGRREINELIAGLRSEIDLHTHKQTLHPDRKAL
jgi:hypothetical protein